MFPVALIVFREFLEMALIVGIVAAATRGLPRRVPLIVAGMGVGVLGAVLIALFTGRISDALDGRGQELLNAAIMFTAVGFIGHTLVWMKRHGREAAARLTQAGREAAQAPLALVAVIASAVFREGAEVVLFGYGMLVSGQTTLTAFFAGAAAGALAGAVAGGLFYLGLMRTAQKYVFSVGATLLMFLCAGMAAQGAAFLTAADVLPALIPQVWDTSAIVSSDGMVGKILGVLVGYTPQPSGLQLLLYVGTLSGLYALCRRSATATR